MLWGQGCGGGTPSGPCPISTKNACVNACNSTCSDIGECIFGCEIGGINTTDTCSHSCNGLGSLCIDRCLATVQCISTGCAANVTSDVALNLGTPVLNRATGVWQQTIKITNTSGETLTSLSFVLDTLAAGWTVTNGDGTTNTLVPAGSPYKNFGDLAADATATVTVQFTRAGTPAFTYSPRVVTGATR
jgi:hypothetical protein